MQYRMLTAYSPVWCRVRACTLRRGFPAILLLIAFAAPALPQERQPAVALTAGLGNVLGGLGAGVEYYLAGSRVSLAGGIGYWPEESLCDHGTLAGAGALRAFLLGRKHRLFVEASYSLLQISCFLGSGEIDRHYGPGLSLGYRYTSSGGFTFTAGGGVGDGEGTVGLILLGVGYSWQR